MHLFLYGPPGTGKSTIGKILARHLSLPFVDLDRLIETAAGMSIPQIMEKRGESAFRELESTALKDLLGEKESVIALGGGALLREENRAIAEGNGKVVLLTAELPTLLERLQNDSDERPLLAGDLRAKLGSLLAKRSGHYSSFALRVDVDDKMAEQNAYRVQIALGRFHLSAMGKYDVIAQNGGVDSLGEMLQSRELRDPIIVTDENVGRLHVGKAVASLRQGGFDPKVVTFHAGEEYKNQETVSFLWKSFLENGLDHKSMVIALGGGVVSDLAGFAASTYMRGIDWVAAPTTLLAMADASLGGKTGFDLPEGKNLIGSFHPPKLVLADPQLLETLPERELISGMAEVVKHGIISDPELFALCSRGLDWAKDHLEEIVKRAMAVKIKIVEEDPYEKGVRAALNLGHTVGHAVELVSKFKLRHGEAVAIGIAAEARYAVRVGLAGKGLDEAIAGTMSAMGLPIHIPKELPRDEIVRAMRVDKKKDASAIRFALPVELGHVGLVDVEDAERVISGQ